MRRGQRQVWWGVGFLLIAAWQSWYLWRPHGYLEIPLCFDRAGKVSAPFVPARPAPFDVMLELDRKLPEGEMDSLLFGPCDNPPVAAPRTPLPKVAWTIEGQPPATRDQNRLISWGGQTTGTGIGYFETAKGGRYQITVRVDRPEPRYQMLNPRLVVALGCERAEKEMVEAWLLHIPLMLVCGLFASLNLRRGLAARRGTERTAF